MHKCAALIRAKRVQPTLGRLLCILPHLLLIVPLVLLHPHDVAQRGPRQLQLFLHPLLPLSHLPDGVQSGVHGVMVWIQHGQGMDKIRYVYVSRCIRIN